MRRGARRCSGTAEHFSHLHTVSGTLARRGPEARRPPGCKNAARKNDTHSEVNSGSVLLRGRAGREELRSGHARQGDARRQVWMSIDLVTPKPVGVASSLTRSLCSNQNSQCRPSVAELTESSRKPHVEERAVLLVLESYYSHNNKAGQSGGRSVGPAFPPGRPPVRRTVIPVAHDVFYSAIRCPSPAPVRLGHSNLVLTSCLYSVRCSSSTDACTFGSTSSSTSRTRRPGQSYAQLEGKCLSVLK